jgi:hypothetical protein
MQTKQTNMNIETAGAAARSHSSSAFLKLADARARFRKIRVALSFPHRRLCSAQRAMIAALRKAEYVEWQATGGDYLTSMQPIA